MVIIPLTLTQEDAVNATSIIGSNALWEQQQRGLEMADTFNIISDRSRKLEYQRCPRARYLGYHIYGTGIQQARMSIPLVTGTHVHRGIEALLIGKTVDEAVKLAVTAYRAEIERRGLDIGEAEEAYFVAYEQMALVEALIRTYAIRMLPELLARYDVVEVEFEDCETMLDSGNFKLDWQAKADALLREKSSGDLYVYSLKTAAGWDKRKDRENRHDDQGLSELWTIETRMRRKDPNAPEIQGIKMDFLIKGGRKETPKDSGRYVTYNHLIRGWKRIGIVPGEDSYAWRWEYPDPANPEKKKRLSYKNWAPFNVWEEDSIGGVKGWIEMLSAGVVQPGAGDPLRDAAPEELRLNPGPVLFVSPVPYFRQPEHVSDWVEQTQNQEERVAVNVELVETARKTGMVKATPDVDGYRSVLNIAFPQNRRACDWPSQCQFQSVCFENVFGQDPRTHGDFINRVPHHETELKRWKDSVEPRNDL